MKRLQHFTRDDRMGEAAHVGAHMPYCVTWSVGVNQVGFQSVIEQVMSITDLSAEASFRRAIVYYCPVPLALESLNINR